VQSSDRNILLGVFVLALLLRIFCLTILPPTREWADAGTYDTLASQIIEGKGFTSSSGAPTRIRPPVYPLFVAATYFVTGRSPLAAAVVQTLIGSLAAALLYFIAIRFADRRVALTASFIAATYPALIFYDSRLLREGFTASLVVLSALAAFRAKKKQTAVSYLTLGAALGTVSMCRPETVLLAVPLFWIAMPAMRPISRVIRPAAIIAGTILLAWTPWTVRNVIHFGSVSPVHAGLGSTLWFGSRWAANNGDDHTTTDRQALQQETRTIQRQAGKEKADGVFFVRVLNDIGERPYWFAHMVGRKALMFWKDANGVRKTLPKVHPWMPIVVNTYYYSLLALAALGAVHFRHRIDTSKIAVLIISYMGIYAVLHVRNRYRIPILPMVFLLSSLGFWGCIDWMAERNHVLSYLLEKWSPRRSVTQ
jgi:4-amino-4-deoxy-L-arabinose transferase-like glycosyltransferase